MGFRYYLFASFLVATGLLVSSKVALAITPMSSADEVIEEVVVAQARSCKAVRSCEEAVILWCSGYRRADADNDGIPCENVCSSKREVDEIRRRIGC
jgi:hypothetical protein